MIDILQDNPVREGGYSNGRIIGGSRFVAVYGEKNNETRVFNLLGGPDKTPILIISGSVLTDDDMAYIWKLSLL